MRESSVGRELSTTTLLTQLFPSTPDRRSAAVRCSALAAFGNDSDSTADPFAVKNSTALWLLIHRQAAVFSNLGVLPIRAAVATCAVFGLVAAGRRSLLGGLPRPCE